MAIELSLLSEGNKAQSVQRELRSETYTYAFIEVHALGDDETAYRGEHQRNISAKIVIEEHENGNANVTIELQNTMDSETYPVQAHDMADRSTTPNNSPYNETPTGDVFADGIEGTVGSASFTNESSIAYDELINEYEGILWCMIRCKISLRLM